MIKLIYLRGVNGGLSKGLMVHPLTDPATKLTGSFISYKAVNPLERIIYLQVITSHIPSNGTF